MSRFKPAYQNRLNYLEYMVFQEYRAVQDTSGAPGPEYGRGIDDDRAVFGIVPVTEFADIVTGAGGTFNTSNILSITGVPGTNEYGDNIPWLKFSSNGTILYVPLKPLSRSVSWDQIYNAGCVYGTGDQGILPPNGRLGSELTIEDVGGGTIGITTTGHFLGDESAGMDFYDTVGAPGDTIVLAGWSEAGNNGEHVIDTISDTEITVVGGGLTAEAGTMAKKLWNKANEVTQNQELELASGHNFKVRLLKGAEADPANYASNRGQRSGTGDPVSEWVRLIMPLHERASDNSWNYSYHDNADLIDWSAVFYGGLTDADLITHNDYGLGSYSWVQEARGDDQTFRRLSWGNIGASTVVANGSWPAFTAFGFRPVLQLIP